MPPDLHFEILSRVQLKVWNVLKSNARAFAGFGFYLAGGTALALQMGQGRSVDFDFFSNEKRPGASVRHWIENFPKAVIREADAQTVHADLGGVKVSFIGAYQYPTAGKFVNAGGIRLASVLDIALMKLLAVTHRAALRDYIDLAAIIRDRFPLAALIRKSRKKYGRTFNPMLVMRALVSFEDRDAEQPFLIDRNLLRSWQKILTEAVRKTAASGRY
jgi:hypothetical protein